MVFQGKDTSMGSCTLIAPPTFWEKGRLGSWKAQRERYSEGGKARKEYGIYRGLILYSIGQFHRKCKVEIDVFLIHYHVQGLTKIMTVFFFLMAIGRLLPSAERNASLCICILLHVCLLRGELPVCKAIHLLLLCYIAVITRGGCLWKGHNCSGCLSSSFQQLVSVSLGNYFCTVATFYS